MERRKVRRELSIAPSAFLFLLCHEGCVLSPKSNKIIEVSVSQRRDCIIEDGLFVWVRAVQRTIHGLFRLVVSGRMRKVRKLAHFRLRIYDSIVLGKILILSLCKMVFSLPLIESLHVFPVAFLQLADALLHPSRCFRRRI